MSRAMSLAMSRAMSLGWLLLPGIALLPAGCDDGPAPEYARPLAEWRQAGVTARSIPIGGGPTLQVPQARDVLCTEPNPSNNYVGCSFHLDETSGRLATDKTAFADRLDVEMVFERGRFINLRNEARIAADQRPANGPPLPEAAVEQVLIGVSSWQPFAVGCWHRVAVDASGTGLTVDGPYTCTLVIENRSQGATVVDYPAPPPTRPDAPLDRARLDRIVETMAGIEASFLAPPGRG